jgi:hypothetical protein
VVWQEQAKPGAPNIVAVPDAVAKAHLARLLEVADSFTMALRHPNSGSLFF